jgi:two-component system, NarL family, nitrate/nitrite response regulator NarL
MTRILFADDHNLVREALLPFLQRLTDETEVREADNLDGALEMFSETETPDLILLDLNMPGMDGYAGIGRARAQYPAAKVAVISAYFDVRTVTSAIDAGAHGFIPKTSTRTAMMQALRLILAGDIYVPPGMMDAKAPAFPAGLGELESPGPDSPWAKLTPREADALRLLIDGKTNKEIARELGLNEITIKGHLRNTYKKIGAGNRADAVRIAFSSRT